MIGPFALLLSAGVLKNGSDVFNIIDPDSGGASSFTVKLSATGLEPVTHYGANTYLEEATVTALKGTTTAFKAYVDWMVSPEGPRAGRTPVGSVTAFKNSLVMGEQGANFWDVVAANSLKPITQG